MEIGFMTYNTHLDLAPADLARALEERGFESMWCPEHAHVPTSRPERDPTTTEPHPNNPVRHIRDPYISLMAAASATTTLKLGTGVALPMMRDVFSQAKTISTLDELCKGRLMIGAAGGWNQQEFENVSPHPWKKRYSLLSETVAALRTLWQDEVSEYHGDFINFDPVWSFPKPQQPKGPPILLGVMGPVGMRHAAKWADGWFPFDMDMQEMGVETVLNSFREQVKSFGRDPKDVPVSLLMMAPPDLDKLKEYRDMGFDRVVVGASLGYQWANPGYTDLIMPFIDQLAEKIPLVR